MTKPRKKKNAVPEAYDLLLMEQIESQMALMREMTHLVTELRARVEQIERTVRDGTTANVVRFPVRPN
jgi:hypothetical protein